MAFREMRNILRMSYNYQDNGELMNQIEQKLPLSSQISIECCEEMVQLTNSRLGENQKGNKEAMRRTEMLALWLGQYSEAKNAN